MSIPIPPRRRLLNPGPVTLSDGVRAAMNVADQCHREPQFLRLMRDVRNRLATLYPSSDPRRAVLVTGSGTAAVESMLATFVPKDRPAVVIDGGVYGARMAEMIRRHGKPLHVVKNEWTQPADLEQLDTVLTKHDASFVVAVHHETTTGRIEDLTALASVAARHGVPMLIDGVSSFGGVSIDLDALNIAAIAGTSNKCLHSVPGTAFVVARADLLDAPTQAPSLYLDLATGDAAQQKGFPAFTPAVQTVAALDVAIDELTGAGGVAARQQTYLDRTARVLNITSRLSIRPLLSHNRGPILTAFELPAGLTFERLDEHLLKQDFVIYAGQKHLLDKIFRIAVMGDLTDRDFDDLERSLTEIVTSSTPNR